MLESVCLGIKDYLSMYIHICIGEILAAYT